MEKTYIYYKIFNKKLEIKIKYLYGVFIETEFKV